jgi:hypothetical protein
VITCRPADLTNDLELHFIANGWVDSYKAADSAGMIQIDDFFRVMIPQVTRAMQRPDVRTMVAAAAGGEPGVTDLVGFIVADTEEKPPLVYYVYTKAAYRRGGRGRIWEGSGVARALFEAIGVDPGAPFRYVCKTAMVSVLARKIPMARWQPLLGRFPKAERRKR